MFSFVTKKRGLASKIVVPHEKSVKEILDECQKTIGYVPSVAKSEADYNGDKFGGYPSLEDDYPWPFCSRGDPMTFLCQLTDPQDGGNAYQIFACECDHHVCRRINYSNCYPRIPISPSAVLSTCYRVGSWQKRIEPAVSVHELIKEAVRYGHKEEDITETIYDWYKKAVSGIKFHGNPDSCQNTEYPDSVLQLEESIYFKYSWGDAGILHVWKDGKYEWDCA